MSAAHPALEAGRLTLSGVPGSPYTRKMLALLRYRRIPYRLLLRSHDPGDLPKPRVPMLPTFYLPNAHGEVEAVTDSTPLIRRFESEFEGREAIPADPALALIDALIEDYGDEWLTKAMFHYRWAYDDDIHRASRILPTWSRGPFTDAAHRQAGADISTRQIPRLSYVGSSHITGPVIEESYGRFLDIFEDHLRTHPFWLGRRPGSGDFAVYGQLTQLALFPEPRVRSWRKSAGSMRHCCSPTRRRSPLARERSRPRSMAVRGVSEPSPTNPSVWHGCVATMRL
jgi:glutathione S-transferase